MRNVKIKLLLLAALLLLGGAGSANACDGLPKEVSQFMEELDQAGVATNCMINQIAAWTVSHAANKSDVGAIMTETGRLMTAVGFEASQVPQTFGQASFDAWRKNEGGVPKAFAALKGSSATVIYIADKQMYLFVPFREYPKNESKGFNIKVELDPNSRFSDEDKKAIDEAVGWWKDRIGDNFQLTLDISIDPSINAGGTTLVGDVPRSCIDHQPSIAEIKLKSVNSSLVSHEIGHALGIGTAAVFKNPNVCTRLAEIAKDITEISVSSPRIENGKFFGNNSKGVLLARDSDGSYGHVSSEAKDEDGNSSAVQPGLGGKPSLLDLRILEDLGYEIK